MRRRLSLERVPVWPRNHWREAARASLLHGAVYGLIGKAAAEFAPQRWKTAIMRLQASSGASHILKRVFARQDPGAETVASAAQSSDSQE
jgi:hypothetical protein